MLMSNPPLCTCSSSSNWNEQIQFESHDKNAQNLIMHVGYVFISKI